MLIEKDKSYKNDELFKDFNKKSKNYNDIDCEIHFENIYGSNTKTLDLIRVWYPADLYGHSFRINGNEISVTNIDKLEMGYAIKVKELSEISDTILKIIKEIGGK